MLRLPFLSSKFYAVALALAPAGAAFASESASVTAAQKYIKQTGTSGDVYLIYDTTATPAVTYLAISHTRGLLDLVVPKTTIGLVNPSKLSLAPGLQFHLLVYSASVPTKSATVTYTAATTQAGQSNPPTNIMASSKAVTLAAPTAASANELYDFTRVDLLTPATGSMEIDFDDAKLEVTKAAVWDWSAAVSPTFVEKFDGSPAFGVTALSVPFGTNSNLSIDTVGVFSSGSTSSSSLGEALSYTSVIGSSYINSGHDLFGFAISFKLSFGISGFDLSNHTFGSTPFVAAGISIPFKTKS